jgi:16S rRNA processing protein RimM
MSGHARKICLGAIAGAHGVKGAFKVKCFTADAANIDAYGPLTTGDGKRAIKLKVLRVAKPGLVIATAAEVKSREDAQALTGTQLFVDRDKLPPTDDEDEFYLEDLIGLRAETEAGDSAGVVKAVFNFGAGDLIELKNVPNPKAGGKARTVILPFTKAAAPFVDLEMGKIIVAASALAADTETPEIDDETGEIVSDDIAVNLDAMRGEDA